jgi:hypothetical protein
VYDTIITKKCFPGTREIRCCNLRRDCWAVVDGDLGVQPRRAGTKCVFRIVGVVYFSIRDRDVDSIVRLRWSYAFQHHHYICPTIQSGYHRQTTANCSFANSLLQCLGSRLSGMYTLNWLIGVLTSAGLCCSLLRLGDCLDRKYQAVDDGDRRS